MPISPLFEDKVSLAFLCVGAFSYSVNLLGLSYAFFNFEFPPLKAKKLLSLLVGLLAWGFWWVGTMQATGFFRTTGVFSQCALFTIWFQYLLGAMLLITVLLRRVYSLYHTFIRLTEPTWVQKLIPSILVSIPAVGLGIMAFIAPYLSVEYNAANQSCHENVFFMLGVWAALLLAEGVLAGFIWRMRNIHAAVPDLRELLVGTIMVSLALVMTMIMSVVELTTKKWHGAAALSVINLVGSNVFLWYPLARPLFGCMLDRERMLRDYILDLQQQGIAMDPDRQKTDLEVRYHEMIRKKSGLPSVMQMHISTPDLQI